VTVYRSDLPSALPRLSATREEFPKNLLDQRRAGDLGASQLVDAGDDFLGQSKRSFCFHPTLIILKWDKGNPAAAGAGNTVGGKAAESTSSPRNDSMRVPGRFVGMRWEIQLGAGERYYVPAAL
jgi:hypothetical protein